MKNGKAVHFHDFFFQKAHFLKFQKPSTFFCKNADTGTNDSPKKNDCSMVVVTITPIKIYVMKRLSSPLRHRSPADNLIRQRSMGQETRHSSPCLLLSNPPEVPVRLETARCLLGGRQSVGRGLCSQGPNCFSAWHVHGVQKVSSLCVDGNGKEGGGGGGGGVVVLKGMYQARLGWGEGRSRGQEIYKNNIACYFTWTLPPPPPPPPPHVLSNTSTPSPVLSVCVCACLSTYFLSAPLSVCLPVCLNLCLSLCISAFFQSLSVCLSTCVPPPPPLRRPLSLPLLHFFLPPLPPLAFSLSVAGSDFLSAPPPPSSCSLFKYD